MYRSSWHQDQHWLRVYNDTETPKKKTDKVTARPSGEIIPAFACVRIGSRTLDTGEPVIAGRLPPLTKLSPLIEDLSEHPYAANGPTPIIPGDFGACTQTWPALMQVNGAIKNLRAGTWLGVRAHKWYLGHGREFECVSVVGKVGKHSLAWVAPANYNRPGAEFSAQVPDQSIAVGNSLLLRSPVSVQKSNTPGRMELADLGWDITVRPHPTKPGDELLIPQSGLYLVSTSGLAKTASVNSLWALTIRVRLTSLANPNVTLHDDRQTPISRYPVDGEWRTASVSGFIPLQRGMAIRVVRVDDSVSPGTPIDVRDFIISVKRIGSLQKYRSYKAPYNGNWSAAASKDYDDYVHGL